jgi:hypothetical protein
MIADVLIISLNEPGQKRPNDFKTSADSGKITYVLKRTGWLKGD